MLPKIPAEVFVFQEKLFEEGWAGLSGRTLQKGFWGFLFGLVVWGFFFCLFVLCFLSFFFFF